MKSVQICLTQYCNQACYMCEQHNWKNKSVLPIEKVKEYLEKYKDCTITFTGGDPLCYNDDDLLDLSIYCKKNNINYQVFTNLYFYLSTAQKEFLKNAEVVQVSFDGSNSTEYKKIRGVGDIRGYANLLYNIIFLKEHTEVKLNCTLSVRNYKNLFSIIMIVKQLGVKIRFFPVHTNNDVILNDYMFKEIESQFALCKIDEDNRDFLHNMTNYDTFEFKPRESYLGKCYIKSEHLVIGADGKEYPCCRAMNDNGEDWNGKYSIDNLNDIEDPDVLYEFCSGCDRYRKFNENWEEYKNKSKVYL